ncbi:MAG TPA: hypothetical protein VK912_11045 [Longimicrobiales bacterium]|nr:hypothetical protein [Longimicrobiales bacterium]
MRNTVFRRNVVHVNRIRRAPLISGWALVLACASASCAETPDADLAQADAAAIVDAQSPRDLAGVVEQMMPALERLSGLDRLETLRVRRQSRDGARAYVEARLDEEMTPAERDAVRRTYVALGLLADTLDLDALLLDLYTEQVLGYYDPKERTLFVVSGEDVEDLQPVIAHELVHALQDQHTDLDSLVAGDRGNDRQMAAHAALEGHAMLVMFALLAEQATDATVDPAALPDPALELGPAMEAQNEEYPVFRRAPPVIRETLLFPYLHGVSFVHALWSARRPLARYPAPLDSLLPQSTEQVMNPIDRFILERDEPTIVELDGLPAGWRIEREDEFGQLETAIFLEQHLGAAGRAAAEGWDGDRYALLVGAAGAEVVWWRSVWDTGAHADAFGAAVRRAAVARGDRDVTVTRVDVDGRPGVTVVDAPAGTDTSLLHADG